MLGGRGRIENANPYGYGKCRYYNSQTNDAISSVKFTGRGRWCFWETKALFRLGFPKISLSLGYAFSNLDIYTNYRRMTVEHVSFASFYPKKKQTQTFFLKLSFPMWWKRIIQSANWYHWFSDRCLMRRYLSCRWRNLSRPWCALPNRDCWCRIGCLHGGWVAGNRNGSGWWRHQ